MINPETVPDDFQTLESVNSRTESDMILLPVLSLLNKLLAIAISIGWIIFGTGVMAYGFIDMFARIAVLEAGLHKLLRRPPSAGRVLLGATMIFAGSMDLFMKSILCTSCIRENFANISPQKIYHHLYKWLNTTATPAVADVAQSGTDSIGAIRNEVIDLIHINPQIVYRFSERITAHEPELWPEFCEIDMARNGYRTGYNLLQPRYAQEFE